ncbi:MAG TPA: EF-hand domain-containing protein [Luteibacter sp.]|uniref:EF-hand domain-containing protein n=1 Tax=Luteibacter sp. TaxID=1886636 RepID=UPI002CD6CCB0|nr:EF-hand domain-containing protein [Luteibacter sp.]HVI54317.1 EF-hand domain-containing protein [Luteibacter sp.]
MNKQARAVALGASLLLAGAAFAQVPPPATKVPPPPPSEATPPPPADAPPAMPPPAADPAGMPPPASNAPPPPNPEAGSTGTTMPTAQGQVTVNSGPAPAKPSGPAPDFATLSGGKGYITPTQASAFPLLANDFQYADANRDGKISKAEYQKWVQKSGASGQ